MGQGLQSKTCNYKIKKKKKGENLWDLGLLGKEFLDDTKSMIHKQEKLISWTSSKLKAFTL